MREAVRSWSPAVASPPIAYAPMTSAWLVSDGRVLASAEVAATRAERRRGLLGRDGLDGARAAPADPVGAHDRDALPDRRRLPRRRRQRAQDGADGPPPRRHARAQGQVGGGGRGRRLRPVGPARGRHHRSPGVTAAPTGRLVLVSTPIGNLADLSPRAVEALAGGRRHRLRGHPPHRPAAPARRRDQAAPDRGQRAHRDGAPPTEIVRLLDGGATVAVVTDAGTPGVSDPGERIVAAAVARRPRRGGRARARRRRWPPWS